MNQTPDGGAGLYDAYYYAHDCGTPYERNEAWLAFFGRVADWIVHTIGPRSVLDAGCAMGFLVEALRGRGVEAEGLDISEYAIAQVHPDVRAYCRVGSVTEPFGRRYDLIVCQEVLEHLPAPEPAWAIANLAAHTDDLLFSSTPLDYREATHFSIQPPDRWAAQFAAQGLFRDVEFDTDFLTPWAMRLRRLREPPSTIVARYERALWRLAQERQARRELGLELRRELVRVADGDQAARRERDIALAELGNLRAYVAEQEARVRELHYLAEWRRDQLEALEAWRRAVLASPGWRLTTGLQAARARLAPAGSRRGRWLGRALPGGGAPPGPDAGNGAEPR